jgi:hypothetical protein
LIKNSGFVRLSPSAHSAKTEEKEKLNRRVNRKKKREKIIIMNKSNAKIYL